MSQLVLSLFPGIGLLDMAFEEAGFCVVRGPDVLWGGDIALFHPPARRFDGVIGGPPCQVFSQLSRLVRASGRNSKAVNLVPEFVRCVQEAMPRWFLMENVVQAQEPAPLGYAVTKQDVMDAEVGGETMRKRRFWFGAAQEGFVNLNVKLSPRTTLFPAERAVTRNVRIPQARHYAKAAARGGGVLPGDGIYASIEDCCELQGLPRGYFKGKPFKSESIRLMIGNGVPLAMGRALARAVLEATAHEPRSNAR